MAFVRFVCGVGVFVVACSGICGEIIASIVVLLRLGYCYGNVCCLLFAVCYIYIIRTFVRGLFESTNSCFIDNRVMGSMQHRMSHT